MAFWITLIRGMLAVSLRWGIHSALGYLTPVEFEE